jgi:hypothetical protein
MNYMIAIGLEENGQADLAARIRSDTLRMVEQSGFYEYFDPLTGDGLGGPTFRGLPQFILAETNGAEGAKPAEVA